MDWKGLLKWSMETSDGTTTNKELKKLTEEDSKFIQDAFESVTLNEMKEIMKILDKLKVEENINDSKDIEERCFLLEELSIYLDGLENPRNIVRSKRFNELISYFFKTKSKDIKLSLASVLTQMMQNDKYVQEAALNLGIFEILNLINDETDEELINKYVYLLTGLIFGDYFKPKLVFVDNLNGLTLSYNLLLKFYKNNFKSFKRVLSILNELTKELENNEDNLKLRTLTLEKLKQISFDKLLIEFLNKIDFKSKDEDKEVLLLILNILGNISPIFDKIDVLFKEIQSLNLKIKNSLILTEEEKKEEIKNIISSIEHIKTVYNNAFASKEEENNNNIEKTDNSMLITLKKEEDKK